MKIIANSTLMLRRVERSGIFAVFGKEMSACTRGHRSRHNKLSGHRDKRLRASRVGSGRTEEDLRSG